MIKTTKTEQISYWQTLVNEWLESNLSQQQFCEMKQIDFIRFKNWRYRLNSKQLFDKPVHDFIPLTIVDNLSCADKQDEFAQSNVEIILTDGKKIILKEHLAEMLIKRLLTAIHV